MGVVVAARLRMIPPPAIVLQTSAYLGTEGFEVRYGHLLVASHSKGRHLFRLRLKIVAALLLVRQIRKKRKMERTMEGTMAIAVNRRKERHLRLHPQSHGLSPFLKNSPYSKNKIASGFCHLLRVRKATR